MGKRKEFSSTMVKGIILRANIKQVSNDAQIKEIIEITISKVTEEWYVTNASKDDRK